MSTLAEVVSPVMPRIYDALLDEHGPRIQAATLAVLEAQAAVQAAMGSTP